MNAPNASTASNAALTRPAWFDRMSLKAMFCLLVGFVVVIQAIVVTCIGTGVQGVHTLSTEKARIANVAMGSIKIRSEAVSTIQLDPAGAETVKIFTDAEAAIAKDRVALGPVVIDGERTKLAGLVALWTAYDTDSRALIALAKHDPKAANARLLPLYHREYEPFDKRIGAFYEDRMAARTQAMAAEAAA
jgi:hypothetical protein